MAAEKLAHASTYYKQPVGTDGINDWMEINGSTQIEVFRVTSNESGDWIYCDKISRVSAVLIHNHGATIGTGVRDNPKVTITNGAATGTAAKITIAHTATQEVFSVMVIGEI